MRVGVGVNTVSDWSKPRHVTDLRANWHLRDLRENCLSVQHNCTLIIGCSNNITTTSECLHKRAGASARPPQSTAIAKVSIHYRKQPNDLVKVDSPLASVQYRSPGHLHQQHGHLLYRLIPRLSSYLNRLLNTLLPVASALLLPHSALNLTLAGPQSDLNTGSVTVRINQSFTTRSRGSTSTAWSFTRGIQRREHGIQDAPNTGYVTPVGRSVKQS